MICRHLRPVVLFAPFHPRGGTGSGGYRAEVVCPSCAAVLPAARLTEALGDLRARGMGPRLLGLVTARAVADLR